MTKEDLADWQELMGFTKEEAASVLGVSRRTYLEWCTGVGRNSGKPVSLDRRTELACAAIAIGIDGYSESIHDHAGYFKSALKSGESE